MIARSYIQTFLSNLKHHNIACWCCPASLLSGVCRFRVTALRRVSVPRHCSQACVGPASLLSGVCRSRVTALWRVSVLFRVTALRRVSVPRHCSLACVGAVPRHCSQACVGPASLLSGVCRSRVTALRRVSVPRHCSQACVGPASLLSGVCRFCPETTTSLTFRTPLCSSFTVDIIKIRVLLPIHIYCDLCIRFHPQF